MLFLFKTTRLNAITGYEGLLDVSRKTEMKEEDRKAILITLLWLVSMVLLA